MTDVDVTAAPNGGDRWVRGKGDEMDKRDLVKVKLFDVSPVTFAAYTNTDVAVQKRDAFFAAEERALQPEQDVTELSLIQKLKRIKRQKEE